MASTYAAQASVARTRSLTGVSDAVIAEGVCAEVATGADAVFIGIGGGIVGTVVPVDRPTNESSIEAPPRTVALKC